MPSSDCDTPPTGLQVEVDPRISPAVCKLLDAGKAAVLAQQKEKVGCRHQVDDVIRVRPSIRPEAAALLLGMPSGCACTPAARACVLPLLSAQTVRSLDHEIIDVDGLGACLTGCVS